METNKLICLVTEYASNGELYGKNMLKTVKILVRDNEKKKKKHSKRLHNREQASKRAKGARDISTNTGRTRLLSLARHRAP